jgi:uncharacterized protein YjiS (DUF1127 family)
MKTTSKHNFAYQVIKTANQMQQTHNWASRVVPTTNLKGRLCCIAVGQCPAGNGANMSPLKTISEKLATWRRYREAVRELSQLSNRELDDIGIRRGDIEFIVRRSVASQVSA